MDNQAGLREYTAGDDVVMELIVDHDFELGDVTAVFEHEGTVLATGESGDRTTRIELKTKLGGVRKIDAVRRDPPEKSDLTSSVRLHGDITAANALGEYRLARVETGYRGGRRIPFDPEGTDVRIRVVEDPVAGPRIREFGLS